MKVLIILVASVITIGWGLPASPAGSKVKREEIDAEKLKTDPTYWEQNHDKAWGGFENAMEKWQNWANDANSGNYKLANKGVGAFDNGEFNAEKASDEFFGPDHVKNDWKAGNYTTNPGFGVGKKINLGEGGAGGGDKNADGKGGFWAKLHCRIHSAMFAQGKHLKMPVPCSIII